MRKKSLWRTAFPRTSKYSNKKISYTLFPLLKKKRKKNMFDRLISYKPKSRFAKKEIKGTKCPVCLKFFPTKTDPDKLCRQCYGIYEADTYEDIKKL